MQLHNYLVPSIQSPLTLNHFEAETLETKIKKHTGKEAYYCLYNLEPRDSFVSYQGKAECALGSVVFDFDHELLEQAQKDAISLYQHLNLDETNSHIFFSGQKGFHIYVSAYYLNLEHSAQSTPKQCALLAEKLKLIAPSLDLSIYKPAQKFRAPGSKHPKTGLYKTQINFEQLSGNTSELKEYCKVVREYDLSYSSKQRFGGSIQKTGQSNNAEATVTQVSTMYGLPETLEVDNPFLTYDKKSCINAFETTKLDMGERHEASRVLIAEYKARGFDKDEATDKMRTFASLQGTLDRFERDTLRMIDDAFDNNRTYGSGCYSSIKKQHCSKDCALYSKLVKTKRAQFPVEDGGGFPGGSLVTVEEQNVTTESIDNEFAASIASGFHNEVLVGKELKKSPDFLALREFFNAKHPFVSLKETNLTYIFNGSHYIESSDTQIKMFAHKYLKPEPSIKTTSEFLARVRHNNAVSVNWFKQSTEGLINLNNGVYNLNTRTFQPVKTKDRGFRYTLPYNYEPDAKCPMFDQMLSRITCGDKSLESNLLEFFGYAISNSPCYSDKILVLYGEGSNGKSRLLSIIRSLMGHAHTAFNQRDMNNDSKLRMLENSLITIMEEMPSYSNKDTWEELKGLSSGKTLTVDIKFKDAHSFENRSKFVITCNKLPSGTDPTFGFHRRLLLIPFNATFKPTDSDFIEDIDTRIIGSEMPGVFNRVLKAFEDLKARRFRFEYSEASNEQLEGYKKDSNSVAQWFDDLDWVFETQPDNAEYTRISTLYSNYREWCEGSGVRPVNNSEFSKRLLKLDDRLIKSYDRRRVLGTRPYVLVGVKAGNIPSEIDTEKSVVLNKEKF